MASLGMGVVVALLHVLVAEIGPDLLFDGAHGEAGEVERVGTHVGDVPGFVEALCEHHGLRHGKAESGVGLLLQGGGGEGGPGGALGRVHLPVGDGECGLAACLEEAACLCLVGQVPVEDGPHGLACGCEDGADAVVGLCDEGLYLALALADEAHGHALHAPGAQGRLDLAP